MKFWHIDAFTDEIFKGNPAVVVILEEPIDDELMQNIAIEMNQSETAFVLLVGSKIGERVRHPPLLRWFTPTFEIDLCGHATLSAAHVLCTEIDDSLETVAFDTKFVGQLTVEKINGREHDLDHRRHRCRYSMNFPSRPGEEVDLDRQDVVPSFVLKALCPDGTKPVYARKARDLMLVYDHERTVLEMKPDFHVLRGYEHFIIVTAESSLSLSSEEQQHQPRYDFLSRFFCADDGIVEDPVTGSSHTTLMPYWSERKGRTKLRAYQASKRGGYLDLELRGDRVLIQGDAVTVSEGTFRL